MLKGMKLKRLSVLFRSPSLLIYEIKVIAKSFLIIENFNSEWDLKSFGVDSKIIKAKFLVFIRNNSAKYLFNSFKIFRFNFLPTRISR